MALDSHFIAIFDGFTSLTAHKLEDLLAIGLDVVSHDMHRFLKLIRCLVELDQDQVDQTLKDALIFGREAFEIEFCKST